MCETCGCNITPGSEHLVRGDGKLARTEDGRAAVTVLQGLLSENDHQAAHNREHLDHQGVLALNLMSSAGAGKTSLLEATIEALAARAPGRARLPAQAPGARPHHRAGDPTRGGADARGHRSRAGAHP